MGIVTKMGFGLMPNPGGYESYVGLIRFGCPSLKLIVKQLYTFPKEEDLAQLVSECDITSFHILILIFSTD